MQLSLVNTKNHKNKSNKSLGPNNKRVKFKYLTGFTDTSVGGSPLSYSISPAQPYFDFGTSVGVNSTPAQGSILSPLLGTSGLLKSYPQTALPVIGGAGVQFYQKIMIKSLMFSVRALGSQSNTLAASDLYNTIRTLLFWSGKSYSQSSVNPLVGGFDNWPNLVDVEKVYVDNKFLLSDQSFSTVNNYNAPQMGQYRCIVPVNREITCISNDAGSTWDTQEGDLIIAYSSDSNIPPNPGLSFNIRVIYEIRRDLR